jgi:hypothetical protein
MILQCIFAVALTSSFLSLLSARGPQFGETSGSTLQIQLTYSGSGTIDQNHPILVVLWDSPDFVKPGSSAVKPPIAEQRFTSKSGIINFDHVKKSPVYVSCAYDTTGNWKGGSEPPAGSSLGLYSKEPGKPSPIGLRHGKTTKVSFTLDDSVKVPPKNSK